MQLGKPICYNCSLKQGDEARLYIVIATADLAKEAYKWLPSRYRHATITPSSNAACDIYDVLPERSDVVCDMEIVWHELSRNCIALTSSYLTVEVRERKREKRQLSPGPRSNLISHSDSRACQEHLPIPSAYLIKDDSTTEAVKFNFQINFGNTQFTIYNKIFTIKYWGSCCLRSFVSLPVFQTKFFRFFSRISIVCVLLVICISKTLRYRKSTLLWHFLAFQASNGSKLKSSV